MQLRRRSRQLPSLRNLLRLPPRSRQNALPIRQLSLTPTVPRQCTCRRLVNPRLPIPPQRHAPIISHHPRIPRQLGQFPQLHNLADIRCFLLIQLR